MKSVKVYRYRWLILFSLMLLVLAVEIQWMNLAPIGRVANLYYTGQLYVKFSSPVDLLSLTYMLVFVFASIPSSYAIHRFGINVSIRIACSLIIFASLSKAIYVSSFTIFLFSQFVMAIAQALVLNSITEIVSRWFSIRERGMAVGIVSASQYLSLGVVMVFSPLWVVTEADSALYGNGFERMILIYSIICSVFALIAALLIREKPPTPSSLFQTDDQSSFFRSLLVIKANPSLRGLIVIFSIGWGVLMTFLSKVDLVSSLMGFPDSNGIIGISLLGGGMVGAIVMPSLSDRFRKRKFFYVLCSICSIPGLLMLLFSQNIGQVVFSPWIISIIGVAIFGFCVLSTIPIGLQYAAELGQGVSEEIIQAILMLCSQAFGAIIMLVTIFSEGLYTERLLVVLATLLFAAMIGSTFLKESPLIVTEEERLTTVIEKEIVHLQ
ncbi:Major Facilitator Superfamily transporter [Sphaerochaeta pleomorpha str. Grapes]|uniref:Major Facilitator Superfamily transporter n=1 Tax=Sphaerochaeta pleomorpha (strain ATCC BAA-1885 / DSM 22778 / Grapes) TaxID=158190 RepID=G8QY77_SPHPG|nr:MFS transporter [Sphaerochaeta pleomorpha]AEV29642.1 Major Facilitator Superfamily transporter [Sphaerochaeta pleomorpha str. Grapes]